MLNRKVFLGTVAIGMALLLGVLAACTGSEGAQGPKGDKGDTGATGAQGPQGPAGKTPSDSEMLALIDQSLADTSATAESIA